MKKITLSKLIFLFCALLTNVLFAQNVDKDQIVFGKTYSLDELKKVNGVIRCASVPYEKELQRADPKRMTDAQFEAWISPLIANASKSQNGGIITIPVVVHVIHSGQAYGVAPNITDAQVQSQISVMNNDFRRATGTPGFNTNPVGADVMIQFALAKVDPNGNPTNGIDRVNLCQPSWSTANVNSYVKPLTIWDPTQYMNMWSVEFGGSSSSILGYAQFPSNSGLAGLNTSGGVANTDGVVANYATFGSSDYDDGTFELNTPYDKGRTMTHEVGHFLGLRHIWGDDNDASVCATDYCEDTPPAHEDNYSCVVPIPSCTAGLFEMVENYMDYTNDTCMNIFTLDQKARMSAVMNNSPRRVELKTSIKDIAIPLFANDAEVKLERVCISPSTACAPSATTLKVSLYNRGTSNLTSAVISYTVGTTTQTYTWSGNLTSNSYAIVDLPITAAMPSGSMTVSVTSANSVADQRASNNSFTTNFVSTGPASANNGVFTFTLQNDYWASETTWNLKNSAGTILYQGGPYADVPSPSATNLPAPITQTWNLTAGCYTFTINDTYGDGMYNYGSYNLKNSTGAVVFQGGSFTYSQTRAVNITVLATGETKLDQFAIYPNPAADVLNITKVSEKAKFEIHNAVGQLVKAGEIKANQVRVAELVKGTYIITIKDKNISESIKFIKK